MLIQRLIYKCIFYNYTEIKLPLHNLEVLTNESYRANQYNFIHRLIQVKVINIMIKFVIKNGLAVDVTSASN